MVGVDNNMLGVIMRSIFGMATPCVHDIAGGLNRTLTDGVDHSRIIERVERELLFNPRQSAIWPDASDWDKVGTLHDSDHRCY